MNGPTVRRVEEHHLSYSWILYIDSWTLISMPIKTSGRPGHGNLQPWLSGSSPNIKRPFCSCVDGGKLMTGNSRGKLDPLQVQPALSIFKMIDFQSIWTGLSFQSIGGLVCMQSNLSMCGWILYDPRHFTDWTWMNPHSDK
ncbi:hypothetical protein POX_c04195 [Penicillium oxalicum]|uniref:hypothetical protein n=1 Tax=Penicillium oxalicum TaxID=69781 RepID=UPI0020B7897E|nr:hypothetical protein POX_c04195 [Penicillium oxalicum]KAI2791338.1 hypothetical protein POX_c04195 [Penicillium oxalicum]